MNADLRDASLHETNLSEANLSGADLRGADLSEVDLSRTRLDGAILTKGALTPQQLGKPWVMFLITWVEPGSPFARLSPWIIRRMRTKWRTK